VLVHAETVSNATVAEAQIATRVIGNSFQKLRDPPRLLIFQPLSV